MALELRNRLEASLGLTLSATLVWGHPTIAALATHLASKLNISLEPEAKMHGERIQESLTSPEDVEQLARIFSEAETLSEEELRQMLSSKPVTRNI
jgi:hypothetical protein